MATDAPRLSAPALRVLNVMLQDPTTPTYGLDLMDRAGLKSGTLYPLLARLAGAGWLTATKEAVDPSRVGRPARTYYQLTADGVAAATKELNAFNIEREPARRPRIGWSPA